MITWEDYKKWIGENIGVVNDYMFRGQSNPNWSLITTFHRTSNIGLEYYFNNILPEMSDRIETFDGVPRNLKDPLEFASFLAYLQNYGFPTPLLDWTLSPYIAAYFAFEGAEINNPNVKVVKIFCFYHALWKRDYKRSIYIKANYPHVSIIKPLYKGNKKYLIQKGIFTSTNVRDIRTHIQSHEKKMTYLTEFILPISEKKTVMKELNLMGINGMTLFPSIEGICKGGKEEFFL